MLYKADLFSSINCSVYCISVFCNTLLFNHARFVKKVVLCIIKECVVVIDCNYQVHHIWNVLNDADYNFLQTRN